MRIGISLTTFVLIGAPIVAHAEELRVHVGAAAAHAVGPPQEKELGAGGGGSIALELPVARTVGLQASGAALVLAQGESPSDPTIAARATGAAFFGTLGVRLHPLASRMIAGPWIDANAGFAQTGSLTRPAFDAHLGWDFRISSASRWDVGPFVGYTQIVQPDDSLRPDDARIVWAGIAVSLGAREPERAVPASVEPPPAPPPRADDDGLAVATSMCPEGTELDGDACATQIAIVDDRIVLGDVIHFEFDSPRIRTASRGLVRRVAKFILEHTDIVEVSIEGHADAVGTDAYNQQLSEDRAASTRALLVEYGVDAGRLRLVGHGRSQLKVQTPLADPRNRRVEFIVERRHASAKGASAGKRGQP